MLKISVNLVIFHYKLRGMRIESFAVFPGRTVKRTFSLPGAPPKTSQLQRGKIKRVCILSMSAPVVQVHGGTV